MSEKPKVLIIENSIGITGALKSIVQAASSLQQDFEILFLIPTGSPARSLIEQAGFNQIFELPMKELRKNFISFIAYVPYLIINAFRLRRIVKNNSISLIHGNDIYNLLPAMIRLFGKTTPYVCHVRFLPDKFPSLLIKMWFDIHQQFSEAIIAVSKSVANQLPKSQKVMVIYDGVVTKDEPSDRDVQRAENFTFLYLSNFMDGKGHSFAIQAFSNIYETLPAWKLRFVGGDMGLEKNKRYREALKKQAKQMGIYGKTEWAGFTNDVESEYRKADIVLNFSESESFSLTCLEALFYGKPLIASDCGGPAEIVENGKTGVLVPNKNIEAMANAMERLARNETERITVANQARETVKQKFNAGFTAQQLRKLYNKILLG